MNQSHQFHIHWRNHSPNFVSVFTQLLNSESLVDVTLSADGKQIQAHRVVLSACSNYFQVCNTNLSCVMRDICCTFINIFKMFVQELFISHPCQHPIVILKDVKYEDLCTIIHFMYYGEVNFAQEQLDSVLKVTLLCNLSKSFKYHFICFQTAEILQVKGFPDAVNTETFSSALAKSISVTPSTSPSLESDENEIGPKRKRLRNTTHTTSSSQSPGPPLTKSQESPYSTESRPPSIR